MRIDGGALRGVGTYALVLIAGLLVGAALGSGAGEFLSRLSWDFIVGREEYTAFGVRWGTVAGACFAFLRITGQAPDLEMVRLVRLLAVSGAGVVCLLLAYAALRYLWLLEFEMPQWRLPNPRRHALFVALDELVRASPALWMLIGGFGILRARLASMRETVALGPAAEEGA